MSKITKVYELGQFIQYNDMPILIENNDIFSSFLQQSKPAITKIDALHSANELGLNGEQKTLVWLDNVLNNQHQKFNIVIIQNFFMLTQEEQMKFYEMFKYRKIADENLPNNCSIVIENSVTNKNKISPIIEALIIYYTE